ncbi:MAG: hypothetical protein EA351_12090 [Gemmatimonadales bacterium]|nr:MAG: hypothetical protein EA351_12090 [Gemmatimonadales bacterium]
MRSGAPETEAFALRDDLVRWMREPDPAGFGALALRVLRFQAAENPVYRALVRARGLDPARIDRWEDFPPLPARAFREFSVYCGPPGSEEARFLTSGTTTRFSAATRPAAGALEGSGASAAREAGRGLHCVRDLSIYRTSLLVQAERYLAHPRPRRVLALLPSPGDRPDSSLVHMAGVFHQEWDDGRGGFFANPGWELRRDAFRSALDDARRDGVPTLLIGTAFAWVHWLEGRESIEEDRISLTGGDRIGLPEGSVLVETGGFKGRSRRVPREELYAALARRLGIPGRRIVNEYGMTEMLSQFYEPVLLEADGPARTRTAGASSMGLDTPDPLEDRWHEGPPWVRTRVLDPVTLDPVETGAPGLLCHLDLANLFSASYLLTEDRGVSLGQPSGSLEVPDAGVRDRGAAFRLIGRAPGAEARGCSLVMEALLEETRG